MRIIINFLLKIIASILMGVIDWCIILLAVILWDERFMEMEDGRTFIWEDPKH